MTTIDHIMALADAYAQNAAWDRSTDDSDKQRSALRAAIEQALTPGEPVAWMAFDSAYMRRRIAWRQQDIDAAGPGLDWEPLYTAPQPQPNANALALSRPISERSDQLGDDTALLRQALEAIQNFREWEMGQDYESSRETVLARAFEAEEALRERLK